MSWFWNKMMPREGEAEIQRIEVIWGRDRLTVNLPQSSTPATLSDLKHIVSQQSGIPYDQMKLIYQGLILKDDRSTLSSYGLRNGSRLMLVGTQGGAHGDMPGVKSSMYEGGEKKLSKGEELARRKAEKEQDSSEEGLLSRINETVAGVRKDLLPEIKEFVQTGKVRGEARAAANTEQQQQQQQTTPQDVTASQQRSKAAIDALGSRQRKLSEMLLRALLALDGINVSTEETRKQRKEAVKEVQGYLDLVDETWQKIKAE